MQALRFTICEDVLLYGRFQEWMEGAGHRGCTDEKAWKGIIFSFHKACHTKLMGSDLRSGSAGINDEVLNWTSERRVMKQMEETESIQS